MLAQMRNARVRHHLSVRILLVLLQNLEEWTGQLHEIHEIQPLVQETVHGLLALTSSLLLLLLLKVWTGSAPWELTWALYRLDAEEAQVVDHRCHALQNHF